MASDVKVKIDLTKPSGALTETYPLILAIGKASDYKVCTTLDEVVTAGYAKETDTYKAAQLMFSQNNPPSQIAVCGVVDATDTSYLNEGWRQLVVVGTGDISSVISTVEATPNKQIFVTVDSVEDLKDLSTSDKVVAVVHTDSLAGAAIVGEAAGHTVGSITYKNLIISGVKAMEYTTAELTAIHAANGITIVEKAGDIVTSEGKAMSGEYIDIVDASDYVVSQLEYQTQKVLNESGKIPYDNTGIALLEAVAISVMKDCYARGMIASDDEGNAQYTVDYALRSEVNDADRVARKYVGGQFSFTIAGAIHEVEITGEIIV